MTELSTAILIFVVCSLFIIGAGVGLARFGDELAEKTGWGTLWVGTILVSVATSLPELTINISAVAFEDSPGLALGNVYGANMINMFVMAIVALIFGVRSVWSIPSRDTPVLMLVAIGLVALSMLVAATGDFALGVTSLGGIVIAIAYVVGMRTVYKTGRIDTNLDDNPGPTGSARSAWIGFGLCALVVIIAGRFLASSADSLAEITGIGASFIGVLLVSIVTTLPEGSVTIAAAMRKSYGIVVGNVYGSCAFNIFVIAFADLFYSEGALLSMMESAHWVAAAGAFGLMTLGLLIARSFRTSTLGWRGKLTPAIPLAYVAVLYWVYVLAAGHA